jgi:23S rRNA pseudouridine2605 synthase
VTQDESGRSEQRLQKIIASAGLASRRKAEELILEGRVQVNGQTVTELGTKADPERDHIRVDGKLLQGSQRHRYFLLNKPKGYVTTVSDPEGRPTVMEFFPSSGVRLYPVGRLDYQSEGLLLMTNDGELANKLTKAGSGVEKTYLVKVSGTPTEEALDQLRAGIMIDRGRRGSREGRVMTAPAEVRMVREADNPWYEVILTEGRNREIRKMFEEIGHFVEKIRRVGYGPLVLDLPPGEVRELAEDEVEALVAAGEGRKRPRPGVRPARKASARKTERAAGPRTEARRPERASGPPARRGPAAGRKGPAKKSGRPGGGRGPGKRG